MTFRYTDYHVHTRWSEDVPENGPTFEDYLKIAEQQKINVCFLEHYELYYIERYKDNNFYGGKIDDYLEEIDQLKETYDFCLGGLEVEYYEDRENKLLEFMDDYEKELDFIAGTIHEWKFGYPVTSHKLLEEYIQKVPITQIVDEYFEVSKKMVKSGIFKNVCHIDTIFRYINNNDIIPPEDCDTSDQRVIELGRLCIKNNVKIEYNLSGEKFPIGRSFPSKDVVRKLSEEGAKFFVGSDSHNLEYFEKQCPKIIGAYNFLRSVKKW